MPKTYYKYNAGELRAWHRGHRAYRLGKSYTRSNNPAYRLAWFDGWNAAAHEHHSTQEPKPCPEPLTPSS